MRLKQIQPTSPSADGIPASRKQVVLISESFPKAKTKAEVLWAWNSVASGFLSNSSQHSSTLLKDTFSDSEIAEEFKMGATKLMYIDNFCLVLYFKGKRYSKIKVSDWIFILFDKSFDKITQQCQMDFCVRFETRKKKYF